MPPSDPQQTPWPRTTIWNDFENAAWVVRIADVDPALAGNEVVYGARYSDRIMMSRRLPDGTHALETLFMGIVPPNQTSVWDIAVDDLNPASPTLEILGVDDSGSLYFVEKTGGAWQGSIIWQDIAGPLHAVVTGDFDPGTAAVEIIATGESGQLTLLASAAAPVTPGDMNCNGAVDGADVHGFVLALIDPDGYEARYPNCDAIAADVDGDGQAGLGDVPAFVALLLEIS